MGIKKSGEFVTPGDRIGVIEEFIPGRGTYVNANAIYAEISGVTLINRETKQVSIYPSTKTPIFPKKGAYVVGQVSQVQDKFAMVKILRIGKTEVKKPFSAVLHVSFASRFFLKGLKNALRPGDLIYAQVLGDENQPVQLTIADRELGVFQASCSMCGSPLQLDHRQLVCPSCGFAERRKLSENYGRMV
ncbi:MAG: exosome complex RNA-binding protein Csl4 [Candidatus Bathyarchaeia archaeon]